MVYMIRYCNNKGLYDFYFINNNIKKNIEIIEYFRVILDLVWLYISKSDKINLIYIRFKFKISYPNFI